MFFRVNQKVSLHHGWDAEVVHVCGTSKKNPASSLYLVELTVEDREDGTPVRVREHVRQYNLEAQGNVPA